ncbi:MAG: DinB family protein [Chloroflexi bacterium]|nr:DinB family protein [Chloroflexota bacterium]
MNQRAEALATRLEQGVDQLVAHVESMTPQQWAAPIAQDGRSIGIVVHHVATMYPLEMALAQTIANGQAIAGVTWDLVAEINAKHAGEHAEPDRMTTLALLRQNSTAAATAIRAITDAQLDIAVPNSLYGDTPLTLQFWLEDHPMSHSYKHLADIKAVVSEFLAEQLLQI